MLKKFIQAMVALSVIIIIVIILHSIPAPVRPSLDRIVEDTYMAPYRQTSVSTLQTVTYRNHTSTNSIESTANTIVKDKSMTMFTNITSSTYGSPGREQVYTTNGSMYFNAGRGWITGTKDPKSIQWPATVKRMSKSWDVIGVSSISGGRQFIVTDNQKSAFKILDGLIEQVLLRNNFRITNYPMFGSWLMGHFHESTVIQTEKVDGTEQMEKQITTLSIHLTPEQIKKFWSSNTTGSSIESSVKSAKDGASSTEVYPLDAQYKYSCYFTYQAIQVPVPKGLPKDNPEGRR